MKRLHVHVTVKDLETSIGFYRMLFGEAPTVIKDDYAKWMLDDPRVNFGAYILSLTGRFAGYRSSRLSCNAVAEGWFFRSWAVVLRSCRLMRARNCRLSI